MVAQRAFRMGDLTVIRLSRDRAARVGNDNITRA